MNTVKLLLADDHQIMLDGLKSFLDQEPGIEVAATAHSSEEALEKMEAQNIDVAILDINMPPGIDGIEASKTIKKRYPKTKIILLTMYGDGHYILNALRLGIHGYVMKEKSKETLMAAIRAVMEGARYFSPDLLNRVDFSDAPKPEDVKLTKREIQILCLMAEEPDLNSKEIGEVLSIEKTTVEKHLQNIKEKLDIKTKAGLLKYTMENKLGDKP